MSTKIEWTNKTWNPITGCTKISPGCANCYAEKMSKRLAGRYGYDREKPFKVTCHPEKLTEPLKWKKPAMVFVCSMGDLFHEDVPVEIIDDVWYVMSMTPRHTYQILTKRPERMAELMPLLAEGHTRRDGTGWPLPNVWLGVTAENSEQADKRIPVLLQIPAAVRFVSVEPMLGRVDLTYVNPTPDGFQDALCGTWWSSQERIHGYVRLTDGRTMEITDYPATDTNKLNWVICGSETGPGARPMQLDWARNLRDQCAAADVPYFFKKVGKGIETPADLDVRQWPGDAR